ncbi:hypothetical protein Agub_g11835 [Astrephomene gubernaculifera]|uniref:Lactation elevated 1 n=1 Tax=Astrephomene gubernaculifera TaxID=47775 RepID=A0AAD3HQY6_9CHLO|nr:hypothetical protein Agub_g11835 [Astrephomene gubernaculifera]
MMRGLRVVVTAGRLGHRAFLSDSVAQHQALLGNFTPILRLRGLTSSCGIRIARAFSIQANSNAKDSSNPVIQRYLQMVDAGSLQKDEQQWALVQELGRLYDETVQYKALMDKYHTATAEYKARRLQRLQELLEEDRLREEQQQREEQQRRQRKGLLATLLGSPPPPQTAATASDNNSDGVGLAAWLRSSLAPLLPGSAAAAAAAEEGGAAATAASAARARQAAAAAFREERLTAELGPPPGAPQPPRGLYVWGSVGSGKSMLVAMFYQVLAESAQLPATRWMHFNAAMLEIHARLHHLDSERWRQRDARLRAQQLLQEQKWQQQQQAAAAAAVATAAAGTAGDADSDEEEDEEGEEERVQVETCSGTLSSSVSASSCASSSSSCGSCSPDRQRPTGHQPPQPPQQQAAWDPALDPEVRKQREARAAMLAVRRHMRLAKLASKDPRSLAAANAQGMLRTAASFIRGRPGDPLSGWVGGGSEPLASLLYFDEVQVTDVFSAVALKGLIEALTSAGCVVVATSNRAPHELPRHGLHEDMWGHFVTTLLQRCSVYELSAAADYRRTLLEQGRAAIAAAAAAATTPAPSSSSSSSPRWPPLARSYLQPSGPASAQELEALWAAMNASSSSSCSTTTAAPASPATASSPLPVTPQHPQQPQHPEEAALLVPVLFGRSLAVPRCSPCGGAAWFPFPQLCGQPLGPADYVALAQRFHTVFLSDIPAMSMQVRDQARRFITLIDELYNARCVLVASAALPPEQLFAGAEGQEPILDLEGLQFETAVEDARLRRDATTAGGVAPVAASPTSLALTVGALGGAEERFAFRRAVSRLLEMQSPQYIAGALAMRRGQQQGGQAQQQRV